MEYLLKLVLNLPAWVWCQSWKWKPTFSVWDPDSWLQKKQSRPYSQTVAYLSSNIGRTDVEAETPILWPPHVKSWLTGKDPDVGKDWRWEEKGMTEDEMIGWHHQLDGHESEWTPRVGDGQGSLVCCSPWGRKQLDTTERLNWTELNMSRSLAEWWMQGSSQSHFFWNSLEKAVFISWEKKKNCRGTNNS